MAVFRGSRYAGSFLHTRRFRGSLRQALTFRDVDRRLPTGSIQHLVTDTDRIDLLSFRYYGTVDLWWWILDKNPGVACPLKLPIGSYLWIPPLPDVQP